MNTVQRKAFKVHSIWKCALTQAVNTCAESLIFVQCLRYFSPEFMTNNFFWNSFKLKLHLSHKPLTQALANAGVCCCCCRLQYFFCCCCSIFLVSFSSQGQLWGNWLVQNKFKANVHPKIEWCTYSTHIRFWYGSVSRTLYTDPCACVKNEEYFRI